MKKFMIVALALICSSAALGTEIKKHHKHAQPNMTQYCIYRVVTIDYYEYDGPYKIVCDTDESYVELFYNSYLLSYEHTSIVMTAPGGAVMYARPLQAD